MDTRTPILPLSLDDRLDSWKAIAQHLRRDTRTVQRWEAEGLPVYRHQHSKHGSIYAYKSEIDSWWLSRRPASRQKGSKTVPSSAVALRSRYLRPSIYLVIVLLILLSGFVVQQGLSHREEAQASGFIEAAPTTIAIFPFENNAANSADAGLAQALTQNVLKRLHQLHSLRILDDTSTLHGTNVQQNIPTLMKTVHAEEVLEGSVSRKGDGIHVTAELVFPTTGNLIWSTQFESASDDSPALQDRLSRAIVAGIENASALKQH